MESDKLEVPFTNELRKWLAEIGYTHIFDKGADPADEELPYALIPLRTKEIPQYSKEQ